MERVTQNQIILSHLQKGLPISSMQAFNKYGITRLSARIFNLRAQGIAVKSKPVKPFNGNRYLEFYLEKNN